MKKLRVLLGALLSICAVFVFVEIVHVQTTVFNISAGASVSTINSTLSTAAGTSGTVQVNFAAGNYAINSFVVVPCPVGTLTIQGPSATYVPPSNLLPGSYRYTTPYTANLNGSLSSGSAWTVSSSSCSHSITIQYFNWNGGQPGAGGGGWLQVLGGNVTVQNNYAHGVWANTSVSHTYDDLVDLEGGGSGNQFPQLSNIQLLWNVFGDGTSDCNAIMNSLTYQGGSYTSTGGYCGALGVHVSTTNLVVQNNDMEHLEQPMKFFQGSGSAGDITHTFILNNPLIDSNDCGQWHRICLEGQQTVVVNNSTGSVANFTNNSTHDPIDPEYGMFGYSIPMCCSTYSGYSTGDNQINCNNNNFIDNVLSPSFTGYAFEWWSTGSCSNNLMQGHWNQNNGGTQTTGTGIGWGETSTSVRTWVASNNTAQFSPPGGRAVNQEVEGGNPPPPIQNGNVSSASIAAVTSVAPTISPAAGPQTFPLTVTLTDPGYTSGALPQGHTGIWYTIDGSTPVPGAGTAKYLSSGGTFVLSTSATVKAVGMWGAYNQPASYPSGYGFVPSSAQSATYTGGGTPQAGTPVFTPAGQSFFTTISVSVSTSTPGASIRCTTDGSTPTGTSPLFTGPFTFSSTTQLQCLALASGYTNSAVASATYTFSPTQTPTPVIAPPSQSFSGTLTASITDSLSGAVIYYTTDGTTPVNGGGCTGVGNVCTPITQPSGMLNITSYGASPSASAATNTTALQNCNTAANSGSTSCFIPAGNYAHNALTWTGPAGLYGAGAGTSILTGSSDTNCQITMAGNNWTFSAWKHVCPQTTRDSFHWNIFVNRTVSNFRVDSMEVQGGDAGGFINFFANHGIYTNSYVHDTLADCLYTTDGSSNIIVANEKHRHCGDDSISVVSYVGDTDGIVSNVLIQNNDVGTQSNGRGITMVGGQNVTIQGNLIASVTDAACIYIADEPSFNTRTATNFLVLNNTLNSCSGSATNHPALLLYAGQGSPGVQNGLISGNTINNSVEAGMGTQSLGGTVDSVTFTGNAIVNAAGSPITAAGTSTNIQCGPPTNTNNGSPVAGGPCGGTNSMSATGSSLTWSGSGGSPIYTGPLSFTSTTTLKAIAVGSGYSVSPVAAATYTFGAVVTPTFSPGGQTFTSTLSVSMADLTPGATIYYTTDGSTPTTSSTVYTVPVSISATTTLKAIAAASGLANSTVASAVYTFSSGGNPNPPVIIPGPQSFKSTLLVSIAPGSSGETIHYTTDGTTPTTSSPVYTGAFTITATTTVKAIGVMGGSTASLPATTTYTQGKCPGCWWH